MPFWVPRTQLGWLACGSCSFNKKPAHNGRALDLFRCHEQTLCRLTIPFLSLRSADMSSRKKCLMVFSLFSCDPHSKFPSLVSTLSTLETKLMDWKVLFLSTQANGVLGMMQGAGSRSLSAPASWACLLPGSEPCLPFCLCGNLPLSLQEPRAYLL